MKRLLIISYIIFSSFQLKSTCWKGTYKEYVYEVYLDNNFITIVPNGLSKSTYRLRKTKKYLWFNDGSEKYKIMFNENETLNIVPLKSDLISVDIMVLMNFKKCT